MAEKGHVCFNTDIVKMKNDVENAEKIFKKAVECLEAEMPEVHKECGFCGWSDKCNPVIN